MSHTAEKWFGFNEPSNPNTFNIRILYLQFLASPAFRLDQIRGQREKKEYSFNRYLQKKQEFKKKKSKIMKINKKKKFQTKCTIQKSLNKKDVTKPFKDNNSEKPINIEVLDIWMGISCTFSISNLIVVY